MSSVFTAAETALADLALAEVHGTELDLLVGGLGYTAAAALRDRRVRSLQVMEALEPVISWHEAGLVPAAAELTGDPRCRLVHGDFFALVAGDADVSERWDAVLLDIDHTPRHVLHPSHARFYEPAGLRRLADRLRPGGVFALWSDDALDPPFTAVLEEIFSAARAHVVTFPTFHTGGEAANTVYVARRAGA